MIFTCPYNSPLGKITIGSDGSALSGLWFNGQKYFPNSNSIQNTSEDLTIFTQTICWLDIYFSGENPNFTPPLVLEGTPFRKSVWNVLLGIPYGQTMTYGEIAKHIANEKGLATMSSQAIGGAVGNNPISIIIPCHRVVGQNGSLTGYAGGIDRKQSLLTLEKADVSKLFIPKYGTAL